MGLESNLQVEQVDNQWTRDSFISDLHRTAGKVIEAIKSQHGSGLLRNLQALGK